MSVFVTATGTEIGKTFVCCGLLLAAARRGLDLPALKPVASGYDPAQAAASDAGQLLAARGLAPTVKAIADISPWRFAAPLSPDQAAAREGREVPFADLVAFCRRPCPVLIEGVGGVMVPLDARHTVLDWIAALDVPVLLVSGSYLGALSHTLTALAALSSQFVGAIVVNETPGGVDLDDTAATLRRFAPGVPVEVLRRADGQEAVFDRLLGHAGLA